MANLTTKERYKLGKLTEDDIADLVEVNERYYDLLNDLWCLANRMCDAYDESQLEELLREYE